MKKSCLLLALVMILMTACSTPAQNSQTGSGDENCMHVNAYRTVSEYENYLTKFQLPSDFVHLDSIPNLGTFYLFVPTTKFPTQYLYIFIDANGKEINLEITHNSNDNSITSGQYQLMTVTSDMTSMLNAPCTERSVIIRNGMEYRYKSLGGLSTIVWFDNGTKYKLGGQWPTNTVALIDRLVSISETEAAAAFAEIKQSLDARK